MTELGVNFTEYDTVGNATEIIDPVGNETRFVYDDRDRNTQEIITTDVSGTPTELTRTYEYDAVGNRIEATDRLGRTRQFIYDGLNRQTAELWLDRNGDITRTIASTYDIASRLTRVNDPDSSYQYEYDDRDRLTVVDNAGTPGAPQVELSYNYDANGNLLSVSEEIDEAAAGVTTYSYDDLNRLETQTQSGAGVSEKRVDYTYTPTGQFESISRYSDLAGTQFAIESVYDYDELNRLTNLTHSNLTEAIAFYDLTYDSAGRINSIDSVDGLVEYHTMRSGS
ncbi:RHS repeat-containing protein [Rubidibacter lacunae KORDI 51-2]|uniref:RHS repeat-containing protein n=1 Tax=Rubidibacter lacunae KORDI 51-2 TaxID=582515 RepID=U5D563_9CHRO|nr:RHS repeat-containing protein [Rubidibacter lacunae]ERN39823.1 RHS repeat-containing protein [Rubidibacter lacunae KORDI 51-2]